MLAEVVDAVGVQVTGRVENVTEREAGNPGATWTEKTLVVVDWGQTHFLTVGRDFGPLPEVGTDVVVNVLPRPFKRKDGNLGCGYTALGLAQGAHARPVAAAS